MEASCSSVPFLLSHAGGLFLDQISHYTALRAHLLNPQPAPCGCCYSPGGCGNRCACLQSHGPCVCPCLCPGQGGGARGLGQYRNPGCLTPDGGHWGFTVQSAGHTGSSPGLLSRGTAEALFILVVKVLVNFHSHSFDLFNQPFQGATLFVQDIGRQQQDSR